MAKQRLSMRKIHEVLRLEHETPLSRRQIAGACGIARSTVADYLRRFEAAGLRWPEAATLDQAAMDTYGDAPIGLNIEAAALNSKTTNVKQIVAEESNQMA